MIRWDALSQSLEIRITDDGPGMPQQTAEALVGPLPDDQMPDGSAIRLAAAIVRAHSGNASITSAQDWRNHGTSVRFVVPARP